MELFSINRYDENVIKADPSKEDEILNKLLKKVQKRKRKLEKTKPVNEAIEKESTEPIVEEEKVVEEKKIRTESENEPEKQAKPDAIAEAPQSEFQVLGTDVFQEKQKVQMVLPPWLANPTIIDSKISLESDPQDEIDNICYLTPEIKTNLKAMEINHLFPVQKEVIPWILNAHAKPSPFRPRDICVSAPTGSGKTLAFAVPIVQTLSNRVERKIRALIILPVAELALQVYKVFRSLTRNSKLTVCLFTSSTPYTREQAMIVEKFQGKFYAKADIVVTTPGRLVEHIHSTQGFCLKSLKFLVIDEADRIMEQIHHNWLYHLDAHVKSTSDNFIAGRSVPLNLIDLEGEAMRKPHKMLFSATLSEDPEKLQNLHLFQPKLFTSVVKTPTELMQLAEKLGEKKVEKEDEIRGDFIGKYTTPAELTEKYCVTEMRVKPLTLFSLIKDNNWRKFLCFSNGAEASNRLAFVLEKLFYSAKLDLKIGNLSSALKTNQRKSILKEFSNGKINGLVCSDAISRGIDVPNVDVVISYDVPRNLNTYIHRVGRTARAGRAGIAVTLLLPRELESFKTLLSCAGKENIEEITVPLSIEEDFAGKYKYTLNELRYKIVHDKQVQKARNKVEKNRGIVTEGNESSFAASIQEQIRRKFLEDEANRIKLKAQQKTVKEKNWKK